MLPLLDQGAQAEVALMDLSEIAVRVTVVSTQSYSDEAKVIQSLSAPDINHYDPMKWATQCKPILGDFLKALNTIAPVGTDPLPNR